MMESIVKLRKYVYDALTKSAAYAINDMIDEVERDVAELTDERDMLKRQWEAGVDFDQRLEECADKRADVTLFGVDYMPYPLDADGVPIHVGDMVAATLAHGGSGQWIVDRMELTRAYDQDLWQIALDKDGACWVTPSTVRHNHAPTVEDVLREFGAGWYEQMSGPETFDIADYVERYAARLRLAGEDA